MEQSWQRQLAQLEVDLMTSCAKWKVVFGHHPPRSNGHHNNTVELIEYVEPLLQVSAAQLLCYQQFCVLWRSICGACVLSMCF